MKYQQAKSLKIGDRVMFARNPKDLGTVAELIGPGVPGVTIRWDDGDQGNFDGAFSYREMHYIQFANTTHPLEGPNR